MPVDMKNYMEIADSLNHPERWSITINPDSLPAGFELEQQKKVKRLYA